RALDRECAADDQLDAALLGGDERANDARDRAFVGQRDCGVAEIRGPLDELLRMRRTLEEREVAERMELGVTHQPSLPCRYQRPSARSRNTQSRSSDGPTAMK